MILIRDVHVVASPYIVTNINSQMTNDPTTATNEATVPNTHNGVCQTLLTWDHSGRKRNMSSDHGVGANVNVSLIENSRLRKTNDAVLPKGTKALPSRGVWTNGSVK